jgi:DNA (cytosine-5)-methyltransferase 1
MSSFPDLFRMEGSFVEKWARVGDSVPPLLVKAIAECLRSNFLAPGNRGQDCPAR